MPQNPPNPNKVSDLARLPVDPDEPLLAQLEQAALSDDQGLSWLEENVYRRPERLSLLTPIRLASTSSSSSPSTWRFRGSARPGAPLET